MVKLLAERAPAKINLFLRIVGCRSDGYHELDSIFVPISVADQVRVEVRPASTPAVSLKCGVASLADAQTNLAARAARAFMREFAVTGEVLVEVDKTIPVGAGLGGGSSDAGAVLRMMVMLYRMSSPGRLEEIALSLGADIPFFLAPRPARVGGVGELITPLGGFPMLHLVIAVPPVEVPTGAIFKALKPENWSGPASAEEVREILSGGISSSLLVNDLAHAAVERYPEIGRLKSMLEEAGARAAQMTGSGGAVFGVFGAADEALRAAESLRSHAPEARVFAAHSMS